MSMIFYSTLQYSAESERYSAASLDHSSRNPVGFAGCDSVLPVVTCFSGHREYIPRLKKHIARRVRCNVSHRQDAWRSKTDGEDGVTEARAAVDMKGNSLAGSVLIDDQLIESGVYQTLPVESVKQFQGPVGKRPDPVGAESLAAVIVPVSVLLDPAFEVVLPGRLVDCFHQFRLDVRSDMASKVSKTRDGEFLRGKFEKHGASISLGRSHQRSGSRSYS